jgi:hypothetical protein
VIPVSVRLMLFWFQLLSLLPSLSSNWPPMVFAFLNTFSLTNLDIGYLGLSCDIKNSSFLTILYLKILFPVFALAVILLERLFLVFVFKKVKKFMFLNVFSKFVYVCNFFAIQLFSSMFQAFNCTKGEDGKFRISSSPTDECFTETWNTFVFFDSIFMVFYIVLMPALVSKIAQSAKSKADSLTFETAIRPLCQNYKPGKEWFELIKLGFKLFLVIIKDLLPFSSALKITSIGCLIMVLQWIESRSRPYEEQFQQNLSIL